MSNDHDDFSTMPTAFLASENMTAAGTPTAGLTRGATTPESRPPFTR